MPAQASCGLQYYRDLRELLADESSEDSKRDSGPDYTVAEIAERFRRSPRTVRDWIKSGKLRGYLFAGREYRVTKAALTDFEEMRRRGPFLAVSGRRTLATRL